MPIRIAPKIMMNAGGRMNSSIGVLLVRTLVATQLVDVGRKPRLDFVVVVRTFEHQAEKLGEYHHADAGQETVQGVESQPFVDGEVAMYVDEELRDDGCG